MRIHSQDQIDDYLAGRLNSVSLREFDRHVESCRSCARALRDAQEVRSSIEWLMPAEAPPVPGPEFYSLVQKSIEKKMESGWLGNLAVALYRPRLAYPLLFLLLGLLLTAWATTFDSDWNETGLLGIPPLRYSVNISSEADRLRSRDMVMVSLVETIEGQ